MKKTSCGIALASMALVLCSPIRAEDVAPRLTDPVVEQLGRRVQELEARLARLEATCAATNQAGRADRASSAVPPSTMLEVKAIVVKFEGNAEIGALCRQAVEAQLESRGYVVTANEFQANAELHIVTAGAELGRGFLGITSADGEINVSFSAQLRGRPDGKILFQHSEDESGTPSSACADLAEHLGKALQSGKKSSKK